MKQPQCSVTKHCEPTKLLSQGKEFDPMKNKIIFFKKYVTRAMAQKQHNPGCNGNLGYSASGQHPQSYQPPVYGFPPPRSSALLNSYLYLDNLSLYLDNVKALKGTYLHKVHGTKP